jgi:hypothetical protein
VDETPRALPDTDAPDSGTLPRLSLRLSDAEMIALLAAQRGTDGKHRYSANQIHTLVGGARADVLGQVRTLRRRHADAAVKRTHRALRNLDTSLLRGNIGPFRRCKAEHGAQDGESDRHLRSYQNVQGSLES